MDLSTTYMGLHLKNPLFVAASPLSSEIANLHALEDAGAAGVVMYSLFEEQITHELTELDHYLSHTADNFPEAQSFFPEPEYYHRGPDEYLDHLYKAKKALDIPVVGSLNGVSNGGWIDYATGIEEAGADAIELNVYYIPTDLDLSAADVEQQYVDILASVKERVSIPVAVKLSPFFSSMGHTAKRLDDAGADALVLFNRFYQPDIDLENLEVIPNVILSTPQALRLPLRWIAILYGRLDLDLAATSGIHTAEDVIKMMMVGANVAMICSALLKNGIGYMREILNGIEAWMVEHEYTSIEQMQGSMSQQSCAEPDAFERANYMKALNTYR